MLHVNYSSNYDPFNNLMNVVICLAETGGADNLKQADALIRSYATDNFSVTQKQAIDKIQQNIRSQLH